MSLIWTWYSPCRQLQQYMYVIRLRWEIRMLPAWFFYKHASSCSAQFTYKKKCVRLNFSEWKLRLQSCLGIWTKSMFERKNNSDNDGSHWCFSSSVPIKSRMIYDNSCFVYLSHVLSCCQLVFFIRHVADTKEILCSYRLGFRSLCASLIGVKLIYCLVFCY